MAGGTLTQAQALRVIGQHLADCGIDSFTLDKTGDEYEVLIAPEPDAKKTFLKSMTEKFRKTRRASGQVTNPVRFTTSRIFWLDVEKRDNRATSNAMPDPGNLSLTLRVIGDYLDRKRADNFAISWSTHSIIVSYGQEVERLTQNDLYDLGVHMYLRRSSRRVGRRL